MILNKMLLLLFVLLSSILTAYTSIEMVRGCYYTTWSQHRPEIGRYLPENYVPGLCTHIFCAFSTMNSDFTLKIGEAAMCNRTVALKRGQPDLKVILSFGGFSFSQNNAALVKFMMSNEETRRKFIHSVVHRLVDDGYDGFDVVLLSAMSKKDFGLFLREMRAAFDQHSLLLTVAVSGSPTTIRKVYDVLTVAANVDLLVVIAYAFHGSWDSTTGHNSPLFDRNGDQLSIRNVAEAWKYAGVPKSKLVICVASFGHGWTLASNDTKVGAAVSGSSPPANYTKEAGVLAYYEICQMQLRDENLIEMYDKAQENAFLIKNRQLWFSYDDKRSMSAKLTWIKDNRFAGAAVWSLDLDDFDGYCELGEKFPLIGLMISIFTNETSLEQPLNGLRSNTITNKTLVDVSCDDVGFFVNPDNCESFYFCEKKFARPLKVNCLSGLLFDSSTKLCVKKSHVNCSIYDN